MSNQISDRKAEKSSLESQLSTAQAEADRTKSFADFAALQLSREQTVASLAQSRFDWERVLRELAIVIPHDVWLTQPQRVGLAGCGHVERQLVVKLRLVRGLGEHYWAVAPDRGLRGRS